MFDPDRGPGGKDQNQAGVPSYLNRLTQAHLLTPEEERLVTRAAKQGCEDARKRLAESNMRLVINIARSYHSRAVPLEDLIQEGAIGLMHAIERFDPDKGFRFSTYATHWIRQSIGRAIDSKAKTIRLPAHISQTLRKIERARRKLTDELGKEPTSDQVALELGISSKRLQTLLQASQDLISLDMKIGDSENTTLGSLICDADSKDPEALVIDAEVLEELHSVMKELSERERRVLNRRLTTAHPNSRRSIAEAVEEEDLSRERIKQIETQAIKKLRRVAEKRKLRELLGDS